MFASFFIYKTNNMDYIILVLFSVGLIAAIRDICRASILSKKVNVKRLYVENRILFIWNMCLHHLAVPFKHNGYRDIVNSENVITHVAECYSITCVMS